MYARYNLFDIFTIATLDRLRGEEILISDDVIQKKNFKI